MLGQSRESGHEAGGQWRTREIERGDTVSALLDELRLDPQRVAVLVNDDVVPAGRRAATSLHADDRIEVLTFASGG